MSENPVTVDYSRYIRTDEKGHRTLNLAVEGIHCAGCVGKIERALNTGDDLKARVNLTKRHLSLVWDGDSAKAGQALLKAETLGFKFSPLATELSAADTAAEKMLLRCMAVAGFATGNIMIFSLALWFSSRDSMGAATEDVFHWCSALIALPTVIYAGRPFFNSALAALKRGTTNMDVPISVGVILTTAMSLAETLHHGTYVYFDSAVMLLFLLLSGRFLDQRARGHARAAAQDLLALTTGTAAVLENGTMRRVQAEELAPGMTILVAAGEKILADGTVLAGEGLVDTAALTGETLPHAVKPGDGLLGGMVNLAAPLRMRVDKARSDSMMADIARLMQNAEQGNAAYVRIADRVSRWYTPVVHLLALMTFAAWCLGMGTGWQPSLMIAVTVLVITCPCALGLAVPVAQVLASQRLLRRGLLTKSGDAFERMALVDTVVFDKTGTLTTGELKWTNAGDMSAQDRLLAVSLAVHSQHPLSRAIVREATVGLIPVDEVVETAGAGISGRIRGEQIRLGTAKFCGFAAADDDTQRDVWFRHGGGSALRLVFSDSLRQDAKSVIRAIEDMGMKIVMLSGDREEIAKAVSRELGIADYVAGADPLRKIAEIDALRSAGRRVLMVGDGINDAPGLSHADVSMSPSSAIQLTQNAADIVFQGQLLAPVLTALKTSRFVQKIVRQNFIMATGYNLVAVPMAMAGHVTPLVAAVAMSGSSLVVIGNSLRINRAEG